MTAPLPTDMPLRAAASNHPGGRPLQRPSLAHTRRAAAAGAQGSRGPVGVPFPSTRIRIVDQDDTGDIAIVPVAGSTIDTAHIRAYARERLAGYRVPRRVVIVEDLPRSQVGKIIRRQLRQRVEAMDTFDAP